MIEQIENKILDLILRILALIKKEKSQPIQSIPTIQPITQPITQLIPQFSPNLIKFAQSIVEYENSPFPTNPGDLRETDYTISLGSIGRTPNNFCIFKSYQDGFNALCQMIKDISNNLLPAYYNCSILGFFEKFSPSSDNNNPQKYASFVATKMNANISDYVKNVV